MDAKPHKRCEFESPSWFSLAKEHYKNCICSLGEAANRSSLLPALESSAVPRQKGSGASGGMGVRRLSQRRRNQLQYIGFIRNMYTHRQEFISPQTYHRKKKNLKIPQNRGRFPVLPAHRLTVLRVLNRSCALRLECGAGAGRAFTARIQTSHI